MTLSITTKHYDTLPKESINYMLGSKQLEPKDATYFTIKNPTVIAAKSIYYLAGIRAYVSETENHR
jgi:hypothetical protein